MARAALVGVCVWALHAAMVRAGSKMVNIVEGPLEDRCCTAETLAAANSELNRVLSELTQTSRFFALFKVNMLRECPYWKDDGLCFSSDCAICECEDHEVPVAWLHEGSCSKSEDECAELEQPGRQHEALERLTQGKGLKKDVNVEVETAVNSGGWQQQQKSSAWTIQEDDSAMTYVDLRKNPERFTGYKGDSARKAWHAIYTENCFNFAKNCAKGACAPNACRAERVLFKLISGIHTSINTAVVREFVFATGSSEHDVHAMLEHPWWKFWSAPNVDMYRWRIGNFPDRIQNLYFTLALMLRALGKAHTILDPDVYPYETGDPISDLRTKSLVEQLFSLSLLAPGCEAPFDEAGVFALEEELSIDVDDRGIAGTLNLRSDSVRDLRDEFRSAFLNISSIMDCVGCETCKLWGKLQFLGIGTGLKLLFEDRVARADLNRNEVIALFNTIAKLSDSISWIHKMEHVSQHLARNAILLRKAQYFAVGSAMGLALPAIAAVFARVLKRKPEAATATASYGAEKKGL